MTNRILSWDWKEQFNIDDLIQVVNELSGGKLHVKNIEDTGGDEYAIIVSTEPLSDEKAQEIFESRWDEEFS